MAVFASPGVKPVTPDPNKASEGTTIFDDGVLGTQAWVAATNYDSAVFTNCSDCYIVGTWTYAAGIVANGDQTFIIAPGGSYAATFQDVDANDDPDAIAGAVFTAVDVSALANGAQLGSVAAAAPKTGTAWLVLVNGVES